MEENKERIEDVVPEVVTPATEKPKEEVKPEAERVNYDEELKVLEAEEATRKEAARKGFEMRKAKKLPKETERIEEPEEESEPETEDTERIDTIVDAKVNQRIAEIFVDDIIESVSKNPAEQKLIRFVYNTRIVKSGFTREAIRRDVGEAYAIANRKRLELQNRELKLATDTKAGQGLGGGGSSPSPQEDVQTSVFSKEQIAGWKAQGFGDEKIAKIKENFQV